MQITEVPQPVRIAVNVMRARLTVVGFNLAIIAFQLSVLPRLPGATELPGMALPVHLESVTALLIGLGVSIIALVLFIGSCAFDQEGICTHWSLLAGDLLMYLGLAQSVAGFFVSAATLFDPATLNVPAQGAELATVRLAIVVTGGLAWVFAMYIGPVVSLLRSPFSLRATASLGVVYLLLVLSVAHVNAQVVRLEVARGVVDVDAAPTLFNELLQPLRW